MEPFIKPLTLFIGELTVKVLSTIDYSILLIMILATVIISLLKVCYIAPWITKLMEKKQ